MKQKKKFRQIIIIDESGSMNNQRDTVISGFNEQLITMALEEKEQNIEYLVSLTKFSHKVEKVFVDLPLASVKPLSKTLYSPAGSTRLFDGIGETICIGEPNQTDTLCTIMSDGKENASSIWKRNTVKALIDLRQNENKWGFVYIGANQDAWSEGNSINIPNCLDYTPQNTYKAMTAMNLCRSAYITSASTGNYCLNNLTSSVNHEDLVK